jgi:hypothetical protein
LKIFGIICLGLLGLGSAIALSIGLGWISLAADRPMEKYQKETSRQVYMNSVAHAQGAASGVMLDCGNMRNVSNNIGTRHAFAQMVIQDAGSYAGNQVLPEEVSTCISEATNLISTPLPQ